MWRTRLTGVSSSLGCVSDESGALFAMVHPFA